MNARDEIHRLLAIAGLADNVMTQFVDAHFPQHLAKHLMIFNDYDLHENDCGTDLLGQINPPHQSCRDEYRVRCRV
jgi:hypothetical protein